VCELFTIYYKFYFFSRINDPRVFFSPFLVCASCVLLCIVVALLSLICYNYHYCSYYSLTAYRTPNGCVGTRRKDDRNELFLFPSISILIFFYGITTIYIRKKSVCNYEVSTYCLSFCFMEFVLVVLILLILLLLLLLLLDHVLKSITEKISNCNQLIS